MDFGETEIAASKPVRLSVLKKHLLRAQAERKTSVLVIDEAHLLTGELIEEVRLLSNVETSEEKLLQIILVGQNELNSVLALDAFEPVRQRLAIRVQVEPLIESDVKRYIETRWNRASTHHKLPFSDAAIQMIAHSSGGIPRLINAVCDAALVNAYGTGARAIGPSQIDEVVKDLHLSVVDNSRTAQQAFSPAVCGSIDRVTQTTSTGHSVSRNTRSPKVWSPSRWFGT
jgi:general secretion pathway protein A